MHRNMRGSIKSGCLFYMLILGVLLYVGYKFGEVQWNYFSFREKVFELVSLGTSARRLEQEVYKKEILKKGADFGFEIDKENIKISDDDKEVSFEIYWEAPVQFPFYTYYKEYEINTTRKKGL